jgi:hypothetical protein
MNSQQINTAIREATGIQRDDFNSDLNAMHDAESNLCHLESVEFCGRLNETFHGAKWAFEVIHATARQRAEAFLRVKGLWKD